MTTTAQPNIRSYKRFFLTETLTATIVTKSSTFIGVITDISENGLGFRYIGEESTLTGSCNVNISHDGNTLCEEVKAQVIYNRIITPKHSFNSVPMYKCGIAFSENLSHLQMLKLTNHF